MTGKVLQFRKPEGDVHTEHCCLVHGCKYLYGADDERACSVVNKSKKQAYPCGQGPYTCPWDNDPGFWY
jgi:hypothetical protein